MYEELYASIPDTLPYLKRLGLEPPQTLDKTFLDTLVFAHQCRIPFENLDIVDFHNPISLSIPHLYDKIITQKRGGYCFEMNGLFTQFLKDLGYQAWSLMVRIVRGRDYLSPIMHRGVMVPIDGERYFCDVGFGGPAPGGAVQVKDGCVTECAGVKYLMKKSDDYWWTLYTINEQGQPEKLFCFYEMPQQNVDFVVLSAYCSTSPESNFTKRRFLNRRLEHGSCSLLNDEFTITENGETRKQIVASQEEFLEIAEKYFDLTFH